MICFICNRSASSVELWIFSAQPAMLSSAGCLVSLQTPWKPHDADKPILLDQTPLYLQLQRVFLPFSTPRKLQITGSSQY